MKNYILSKWKQIIEKDGGGKDYTAYKIDDEESVLSRRGEILINWIKTINPQEQNKLDNVDFVLATCTKPTKYPTVYQLKENIEKDKRKYFYNNIINGISTYIDNQIINIGHCIKI